MIVLRMVVMDRRGVMMILMTMIMMIVVMAMGRMIMAVVMLMVIMATPGAVHMFLLGPGGLAGSATGKGFGHQALFFRRLSRNRQGRGVRMIMSGDRPMPISPALGLKSGVDEAHFSTEPLHHFDKNIIVADPQRIRQQLRRRMPIAQMPGHTRDHMRITRAEFHQTLRPRHHRHKRTVFQHEGIALHQGRRIRQIGMKGDPLAAGETRPPPTAILEIQIHAVNDASDIIGAGKADLGGTEHGLRYLEL